MAAAVGNVEGVAVPMEEADAFECAKRTDFAIFAERNLIPAYLLGRTGIDRTAKGAGDELGSEANAEDRQIRCETAREDIQFFAQERIGVIGVGADRPAQDHKQVGGDELIGIDAGGHVMIDDPIASLDQDRFKAAEIFKMYVAECRRKLSRHG